MEVRDSSLAGLYGGINVRPNYSQRLFNEIHSLPIAAIGEVTSGGFGPSVNGPIAMGCVERRYAEPGTPITLIVRGKEVPAHIVDLPFVPHRYRRTTAQSVGARPQETPA